MQIFGTTSHDEPGKAVHLDEFKAQVERMLLNVTLPLEELGTSFSDMVSAITWLLSIQTPPLL